MQISDVWPLRKGRLTPKGVVSGRLRNAALHCEGLLSEPLRETREPQKRIPPSPGQSLEAFSSGPGT